MSQDRSESFVVCLDARCLFDIIREGEEGVACKHRARKGGKIRVLFRTSEGFGLDGKVVLPYVVAQNVRAVVIGKIKVDDRAVSRSTFSCP